MKNKFEVLKGLHPGVFLGHELQKRKLPKGRFALSVNEYPQTIGDIIHEKRGMNTSLSLRIEKVLDLDEGFLMTLQIFHDIKKEKEKVRERGTPDLKKFRPVLFWDTEMSGIDWQQHERFVIDRVFERGNDIEKKEIVRYYGKEKIDRILSEDKKEHG
ncbi:MAG TPA: hypothetical protein VKR53_10215 [Puia sp.]|nr:hypothetical protein [Puia sp.]